MTKEKKKDYDGPLYAQHPDLKVTDEVLAKEEVDEIESELDFLSHFDS
tara:strand:- start:275 stop:418 length:144 start_codon:yes stop_codon:yes gene_type:complete